MLTDPRFATSADRAANGADIIAELEATFASKPLDEWRRALATQKGHSGSGPASPH